MSKYFLRDHLDLLAYHVQILYGVPKLPDGLHAWLAVIWQGEASEERIDQKYSTKLWITLFLSQNLSIQIFQLILYPYFSENPKSIGCCCDGQDLLFTSENDNLLKAWQSRQSLWNPLPSHPDTEEVSSVIVLLSLSTFLVAWPSESQSSDHFIHYHFADQRGQKGK